MYHHPDVGLHDMKKQLKKFPSLSSCNLILTGIGLSALFWVLESALHVHFFRDMGFVEQLYRPDPHEVWMRLIVMFMFVAFGFYAQWIVGKRRRAELAASRASAELRQIYETAADGMRVIDREFNVIRVNETFLALSGASRDETIGKKCYEGFRGPLCHTSGCPLTRILTKPERIECDSEKIRKDGTELPCIVTATPFRGPDGEIIGIVEDFKDISDRRTAEQEILQSRERLRDLAAHLQVIREQERGQIAREIHDELGQALTALKMDIHWLAHRMSDDESIIKKSRVMSTSIDNIIQAVKRISSELRPVLLEDFGLLAAIQWQLEQFEERTGIHCKLVSDRDDIVLEKAGSIAIYRIFQETLTNIARHAGASEVEVSLGKSATAFEMMVCDDGRGITLGQISDSRSFGLIGMRERVHSLVGHISINGVKDQGTVIRVTIPVGDMEKEHDKDSYRG